MNKVSLIIFLLIIVSPICAFDFSGKKLTETELLLLYESELDLKRNTVFAHKGYIFSNEYYKNYFEAQDWYKPVSDNKNIVLSDIESHNITLLKQQSEKIALAKRKIKAYLKKIEDEEIKQIINYINVDNIDFCGYIGKYSISHDNGYSKQSYSIYVDIKEGELTLSKYDNLSANYPTNKRMQKEIDMGNMEYEYLSGEKPLLEYIFTFDSTWDFTYVQYKFS